ncbi:MAG TPA: hypothetical protein DD417_18520 [Elusimicrobia bacterium]|nr:hypothetical protein [Elusimicrobiota bacterium]
MKTVAVVHSIFAALLLAAPGQGGASPWDHAGNPASGPKIAVLDVADLPGEELLLTWHVLPGSAPGFSAMFALDVDFDYWDESIVQPLTLPKGSVNLRASTGTHVLYFMCFDAEDNASTATLRFENSLTPPLSFAIVPTYNPEFHQKVGEWLGAMQEILDRHPDIDPDNIPSSDRGRLSDLRAESLMFTMGSQDIHGLIPILKPILSDRTRDWRLRGICAANLQYFGAFGTVDPLTSILADKTEHPWVRSQAIKGLQAHARNPAVAAAIEDVLRSTQTPGVLRETALSHIRWAGAMDIDLMLDLANISSTGPINPSFRNDILEAIVLSDNSRALPVAVDILERLPPDAGKAFGLLRFIHERWDRDPKSVEPWAAALLGPTLRFSRVNSGRDTIPWLGHFRDSRAVDRLIELLNDPEVIGYQLTNVAMALAEIGDRRALPPLQRVWDGIPQDSRLKRDYDWTKDNCPKVFYEDVYCSSSSILHFRQSLDRLKGLAK